MSQFTYDIQPTLLRNFDVTIRPNEVFFISLLTVIALLNISDFIIDLQEGSDTLHLAAMLLLKGLSFEEIASVRDTKEKTVRQHATAIYRKSGLNGRHEFSAWFFEDFLQTP